jgi:hypothetical protein
MDIKPLIKRKLRPVGLDKHEGLVDSIDLAIRADLEQKAEGLITRRLVKKCLSELIDKAEQTDEEQTATN